MIEQKQVLLHNTPSFYTGYMDRWIEDARKNGSPAANVALLEDLRTLVSVAAGVLMPTVAGTPPVSNLSQDASPDMPGGSNLQAITPDSHGNV